MKTEEKTGILQRYEKITKVLDAYPDARLIAVSKKQPNERIEVLVEAGHLDFGENYLQEWQAKKVQFPNSIRWHFVGQVQSRKVKTLIEEGAYCIHSIGSDSSLTKLNKLSVGPEGGALLQMNLASEEQKGGVSEKDLEDYAGQDMLGRINGLMCIPPHHLASSELVQHFKQMKLLQEKYQLKELSMGMSSDYEIALGEGATMIRVGTSLFGERTLS